MHCCYHHIIIYHANKIPGDVKRIDVCVVDTIRYIQYIQIDELMRRKGLLREIPPGKILENH